MPSYVAAFVGKDFKKTQNCGIKIDVSIEKERIRGIFE